MKDQNGQIPNKFCCFNHRGMGMIQVMMASALLAVVAMTGMQLMNGMSKNSSTIQKRASATQMELILTNALIKPDKCSVVFQELSDYVFTSQKTTQTWSDPLLIGNTEVSKGGNYGDITIADYKVENLVLDADVSGIGWGDLVVSTSFKVDNKNTLTKEVRVGDIKFTLDSDNKMTECSSTSLDITDICEAFDGIVENNQCKNINLLGTTVNTDAVIENGTLKNNTLDGAKIKTGTSDISAKVDANSGSNVTSNSVELTDFKLVDSGGNEYKVKYDCKTFVTSVTESEGDSDSNDDKEIVGADENSEVSFSVSCEDNYVANSGSCGDETSSHINDSNDWYKRSEPEKCVIVETSTGTNKQTCKVKNEHWGTYIDQKHCYFTATVNCEKEGESSGTSKVYCFLTIVE